jgi:HK97 family phage major capsid protein
MDIKEMRDEAAKLLARSEEIRKKYDGRASEMTATEATEWEQTMDAYDRLCKTIELADRHDKAEAFQKGVTNALMGATGKDLGLTGGDADVQKKGVAAFQKFIKGGAKALTEGDYQAIRESASVKAYQADDMAGGGFLILPQQLASNIITLMKDLVFIRGMATTYTVVAAGSLGIAAVDTDPSDADWTTELGTGNAESTMAFGKREMVPHPVAKRIKLSRKLIAQVPNAESIVQDRLAYKFAVTEEKAFLTGTGANQPLGVFTADANGISTSRDTTAANASSIVADDLINVLYSLKAQYRAKSRWLLNRSVVKAVRKLKDSNNNYIWSTALGPGTGFQAAPDTLLGLPIMESEYASGTITTGLYTAVLGDFSFYHIVDALSMQLQVLNELYAETNQIGYILRKETDGQPVLEEAFARLKQA